MKKILSSTLLVGVLALSGCSYTAPLDNHTPTPTTTTQVVPQPNRPASPTPTPSTSPSIDDIVATRAVDGDTIELASGAKVRLLGIDTPERGQCGYKEATAFTQSLVAGKSVVLTVGSAHDKDKYGRLLRYVSVDGKDVGTALISEGLAIARYDSRDGYGKHPKEQEYIELDDSTPPKVVCTSP